MRDDDSYLRKILGAEPETKVVGEAGDGEDAVAAARRLRPDLVLMDISRSGRRPRAR